MNYIQIKKPAICVGFLLICCCFSVNLLYSQNRPVELLIGKSDVDVEKYLNDVKGNLDHPFFQVDKSIHDKGDLMISLLRPSELEAKKGFSIMMTIFKTDSNGNERCISQMIGGTNISAHNNLTYIKKNFKKVEDGIWLKEYDSEFDIEAFFQMTDGRYNLNLTLKPKAK